MFNSTYFYWFNLFIIVLLSVTAFGMSLSFLVAQENSNFSVASLAVANSVETIQVDVKYCDQLLLLPIAGSAPSVFSFPDPASTKGCQFNIYPQNANSSSVKISQVVSEKGTFIGFPNPNASFVESNTFGWQPTSQNSLHVVSDGSNYRFVGNSYGIS